MSAEQSVEIPQKLLSFSDFIAICWQKKWQIIVLTGLFAVGSVFLALSIPNQYRAQILVAPSEEQQGGGLAALASQFGNLASLAGINLRGKGNDKALLTLEVFRSKQFLMSFIERHDIKLPLMAAKEWDARTDTLVIDPSKYDVEAQKWVRKVNFPYQVEPSLFETYKEFRERLSFDRESESGTVLIAFEFYSAKLAQQWVSLLVKDLNEYMREKELKESRRSIEYLQAQIDKSNVAELRNLFYQLIQEQTQKAMLAEAREEFVYKIIDDAIVPEIKSKPKRAVLVVILTMVGGVLSILLVHLQHAMSVHLFSRRRVTTKQAETAKE